MIPPEELVLIKQRLITAADAAGRIATSGDQFVLYDEEEYRAVVQALVAAREDVLRVFAELDVLRGMFAQRLTDFFMEGIRHGNASDGPESVEPVPAEPDQRRGEEVREIDAGTGSGVPAGRPPRKRAKGPKPRRNKAGDGEVQSPVGRDDGASEVDSSPDAG